MFWQQRLLLIWGFVPKHTTTLTTATLVLIKTKDYPVVANVGEYVACNLRTCAVCRLHGAKYAVCRLHGAQSADCMVTVQTKDPRDSFSKFQRNLRFSARINFLTKLPNLRKITSVFLTMVIIRFLACNWGKQWQVCSHGMNGCCDELDSLLPKCPPSFSHNTTL